MYDSLSKQEERLSRFLAMVLRHKPEAAEVSIRADGWVEIPELIEGLRKMWRKCPVTRELLHRIVELDEKGRYEVDTASRPHRIRAIYGHSVEVPISHQKVVPPPRLLHGTARRFLGRIWSGGLQSMKRQYVHLTDDLQTARDVGARRDSYPVILSVDAERMDADGFVFYLSSEGLYLTERVPAGYLEVHEDPLAESDG